MKTEPSIDPTVLALTGQLPSIIILAAVLAYPISLFLLWLYRRAVMRLMNQQTIRLDQTWSQIKQSTLAPRATVLPSLELITISASAFSTTKKYSALCQVIMKRPWQASAIYGIAGAVFVLIMTIVWLISGDIELSFFRCLMIFWIMAWPIVLTTNFITATTNRISLLSISLYFAIYFLMTIIALVRNPDFTVFQVLELWFAFNLAPTALLLTFLNRQVRAVGPMLLVFLMMALLGAVVTTELIGKNETSLRTLISVTSAIGIGDYAFLFMFIVGFSGFSILGWLLAIWIRKGYVTKKLSDQTIVLDTVGVNILFA